MSLRVLTVTNMYPEPDRPAWGSFIKSQVDSLIAAGVDIDIQVIRGYRSKLEYLRAIFALHRRVAAGDYDVVHAHYGLSGIVALMQRRVPVVISYCGNDLYGHADAEGKMIRRGLPMVWLQRYIARFASRVIVKSQASTEKIPGIACDVIPNGVDMRRFRPRSRAECRSELGLDPTGLYVLFPYSIERTRKNYALLAESLERLADRHGIAASPLIIHDVPNEQIPIYMNAANALALTSFWEGSPNAVKEAMACNTPVVSVDVGDVRELIGDLPGNAIVSYDADELADALARTLRDADGSQARESMAWLSVEAIAARIVGIYEHASRAGGRQTGASGPG